MANKGRSERDFFGNEYTHYDSNGKKNGRSEKNIFGSGYTNYDAHGNRVTHFETVAMQDFRSSKCLIFNNC